MATKVYSFLDVVAGLSGPGGIINLGAGAATTDQGISVTAAGDKSGMTIGADGSGMHSLYGDDSGTITVRLLKTSPVNAQLMLLYNIQKASASMFGQNVITITDKNRGDLLVGRDCAFSKAPDLEYAKEGTPVEWVFNCLKIDRALGE